MERCALIVHVVDASGGLEGRDPVHDYEIIESELAEYAFELAGRPRIVVANKVDMPGTQEAVAALRERVKADSRELSERLEDEGVDEPNPIPFFEVSAATRQGLDAFIRATAERVFQVRAADVEAGTGADGGDAAQGTGGAGVLHGGFEKVWEHARQQRERSISIAREEAHAWRVSGTNVERMVIQTEWDNEEAVAFLQRRLERAGVERALEEAGAQAGDEVRIRGVAFEFEPLGPGDATLDELFAREFADDPE